MPASRAKEERMWKAAYRMARSGEYLGWHDIEVDLRALGYSRARQLLDSEFVRDELHRLCKEAKRVHKNP